MSVSIILHPELGVNPRLFCCPKCHGDNGQNGLVLLGRSNYIDVCNGCGMKHIGGANKKGVYGYKECQRCQNQSFTRKELGEHEKIEGEYCSKCSHCFFCFNGMDGRPLVEGEQPIVQNHEPCAQCIKYMEMGVIVISVDEKKSEDLKNPCRTGGWWVMKDEALKRFVKPPELLESILKSRVCFMPDETCRQLGLTKIT